MAPEALVAITEILYVKNGTNKLAIPMEELREYFISYRMELAIEELNRSSLAEISSATLETIFTDREVDVIRVSR